MKALFIGGMKSGKSRHAEEFALKHAHTKPFYLATTEFIDKEMQQRIEIHKLQRGDSFITLEEPLKLSQSISKCDDIVLVECISIWMNNMLHHKFELQEIEEETKRLLSLPNDMVFVLNDVGSGIIPENPLARKFIDINGKISQLIAAECDEVFFTIAGIATKIK